MTCKLKSSDSLYIIPRPLPLIQKHLGQLLLAEGLDSVSVKRKKKPIYLIRVFQTHCKTTLEVVVDTDWWIIRSGSGFQTKV